ncbi:MAG TPA: fumarylacetoacetate hydrolase family protein, partial [Rhizomicrobium sp.]|nr:fumarylacetoacetate hydrolase family protein [Rhizomicrobium sp.]
MKLATFTLDGRDRIGLVNGETIADLSDLAPDMVTLIANWSALKGGIASALVKPIPLGSVHLRAPVPRPRKVMAIGLNYADHVAESGAKTPERQIWFAKMDNVNGPFDPIEKPRASDMVDWEAELVVVIGARCRHVAKDKAHEVVFGYACGNDISVRDFQMHTPQWIVGKSFDTHAPVGPWITTADEVGDPHTLGIRCFVNGERKQNSNTSNLIFNVYDQIV